jgi:DNA-binding MarR family transcriptional regulator
MSVPAAAPPRKAADPATEAWSLVTRILFSERPPRFPSIAQEFDLSPGALKVLHSLEPGAELKMSGLAEVVACDASYITGIVDRMTARGLIERRDSPTDRRVNLIALTGDGVVLRQRALERLYAPPEQIAALSRADQRALRDVLRRAVDER